ncbi:hypothetical protein [Salinispora pacifica]|uniref:hypothetical protein n=1 Tax=Salinispora pacifica TaxID=351187 RepID=UPI00037C2B2B|nr:hypothetical protein [Salinispora pacifica]
MRELDFEPRLLVPAIAHSGQDITGQQAQREPVRSLQDDRVVGLQPSAEATDLAAATAGGTADTDIVA